MATNVNTIGINQRMTHFDDQDEIWLFGYGSLIYKVDFPVLAQQPAEIKGWKRRFWQGSHDHRGTPDAPGRVVTLFPEPDELCVGMAYLIAPDVLAHLDFREKNGYLRTLVPMRLANGDVAQGLVYIATADNEAFLGEAPLMEMAKQIAYSIGPSGRNRDYLFQLAAALRDLGGEDRHVFDLDTAVRQLLSEEN